MTLRSTLLLVLAACLVLAGSVTGLVLAGGAGPVAGSVTSTVSAAAASTRQPPPPPPQLDDFPDSASTGVPAGTELTESGRLKITEDGAVIDGLEIHGHVVVEADDVVMRNSRVVMTSGRIAIRVRGENFLMEDSEIDGQGRANPAIAYNGYTLRRVDIYNVAEGPRISGDEVTIEDSYIHHLVQRGGNHTDAVQVVKGEDIVIRGNNLQAYNPEDGTLGNAAFMFGEGSGPVTDCVVEGNLMNGGNYTVNGGGSGTTGAACAFRDNAFQEDHRYGISANLGPNVIWEESNQRLGTTTPVG